MDRGLSLEQVAKTTKIQQRILERLEAGRFEGLPAEVFVRGFVRSFARCVGLDEDEALRRYAACGAGTGAAELTPTVRALVEAMVDLAPGSTAGRQPKKLTAEAGGEVVQVMMLPETGTVVVPPQLRRQTIEMAAVVPPPELLAEAFPNEIPAASQQIPVIEPAPAEVEAELEVANEALNPPVEISTATVESKTKKKRGRRGGKGRNRGPGASHPGEREAVPRLATGTPSEPTPVVAAPIEDVVEAAPVVDAIEPVVDQVVAAPIVEPIVEDGLGEEPIATATWSPKMPPLATSSVPWRRPAYTLAVTAKIPSLVIDDADPDSAERVLEERAEKHTPRRSFLPPILMDREDRSGRQGGLTLAVIILLIAATLTLSYLMRRPTAGGDGMTKLETPAGDTSFVG